MYGKMFEGLFQAIAIFFLVIGIAVGTILFWLVPLLWSWIKPWLHAITG